MGLIILVIIFVVLAAIIVWLADWTSGGRRYTALAVLNRRLVDGEIDRTEYEEKRPLCAAAICCASGLLWLRSLR